MAPSFNKRIAELCSKDVGLYKKYETEADEIITLKGKDLVTKVVNLQKILDEKKFQYPRIKVNPWKDLQDKDKTIQKRQTEVEELKVVNDECTVVLDNNLITIRPNKGYVLFLLHDMMT